ncbi:putative redoxin [Lyophyllum shimeji]|uniref:thioredoxin-dependent peroxiredoxin n=1 Tax=Lyophyllum shimeji TaxID=47721 RepID=A0A9P3PSQ8_LYOSH|nr:putative redoxin [Lyophyllum shimeji]
MAPRKTSATASDEPPRRSSRIASQSQEEPKPAKPKASKKRPAAADAGGVAAPENGSAAKKARSGDEEGDAEGKAEEKDGETKLAPIDIGDVLPSVTLSNEKGEDVDVAALAAEQGVVFFLVPKADTPGCTTQACGFRDVYPDFTSVGYEVYCLSADFPTAQTKWQTKKELPYPLLSDPKRVLITALGAGEGGKTKRSHFVFGKGGELLEKKIPVKPADSPKLALEFIKSL